MLQLAVHFSGGVREGERRDGPGDDASRRGQHGPRPPDEVATEGQADSASQPGSGESG